VAQILISYRKLVQSIERGRLLPALIRKPYLSEALDFLEIDLEARAQAIAPIPPSQAGQAGRLPCDVVREWRQHAPPPPPPEPRYRFLFEKQEPDFRHFAEMAERDFREDAGEIGVPPGGAAGGAPPRDGPGAAAQDRPQRRRRRHRGGRRRRR
jgi:hypothetical protein